MKFCIFDLQDCASKRTFYFLNNFVRRQSILIKFGVLQFFFNFVHLVLKLFNCFQSFKKETKV